MEKMATGRWAITGTFNYGDGLFSWEKALPLNSIKHKSFLSFYHNDDEGYRNKFEALFGDLIVNKSVNTGDIDSNNSDEYINQLILREYLYDTTVLVVLIGNKTKCRKHVDWEIAGALNFKVGDTYAGILGLILEGHPDFGTGNATYDLIPGRLADNFRSGYAIIRDWTEDRVKMQSYIELAFANRTTDSAKRNNSRSKMTEDTCF